MGRRDDFAELARHYDPLMCHVDYDHWFSVAWELSSLLPRGFTHLDAGCGTGVLMEKALRAGWNSIGMDLSAAMLAEARKRHGPLPCVRADLRALPFHNSVDFVTCLFDSLNFLLEERGVAGAIREIAEALKPGGVAYFDLVTERMMLEHFADQTWTEDNGGFTTTWINRYDPVRKICETTVRFNSGLESTTRERAYDMALAERAVREAGLVLLGAFDAEGWRKPGKRTARLDFVAAKAPTPRQLRAFEAVRQKVSDLK